MPFPAPYLKRTACFLLRRRTLPGASSGTAAGSVTLASFNWMAPGVKCSLRKTPLDFFTWKTFSKRKATRASAFMPAGREAISTSGKSAAARSLLEKRVSQSARAASAAAES